jgi:hypothetical protein
VYAWTDTESNSDLVEKALLPDAREAVDEKDDVLMMVELEAKNGADEAEDAVALLPAVLVGAGEGTTDVELASAAAADAPDPYGYAGTTRSLGNGGTAGTEGSATVGTAGTCGNVGTAGIGTAGGTGGDAGAGGMSFCTFKAAGAAGEGTASTTAGAEGATTTGSAGTTIGTAGTAAGGVPTTAPSVGAVESACVLVSWPTTTPLPSTVAMTSTATVFVAAGACRRW